MKHSESWRPVLAKIRAHAQVRVKDLPEIEQERLLTKLKVDVYEVMERFDNEVKRATRLDVIDFNQHKKLRRAAVEACRVLGISPPRPDKLIDPRVLKARKMACVRATHPDMTGTDASRPAYEKVIAAAEMIEAYNEAVLNAATITPSPTPAPPPMPKEPTREEIQQKYRTAISPAANAVEGTTDDHQKAV